VYVWELVIDSLGLSGDSPCEELMSRIFSRGECINLIFGLGAMDFVLGTSYGAPMVGAGSLRGGVPSGATAEFGGQYL